MTRISRKQLDTLAMANAGLAYKTLLSAVKEHNAMAERVGARAVRIPLGRP